MFETSNLILQLQSTPTRHTSCLQKPSQVNKFILEERNNITFVCTKTVCDQNRLQIHRNPDQVNALTAK